MPSVLLQSLYLSVKYAVGLHRQNGHGKCSPNVKTLTWPQALQW